GERWATLDAQGYAFESTKKKPQGLPIVEAPEGAARAAAIAVAASLPPELATKISKVGATEPENVILSTSSGATVVWGPADQNDLKARILVALLAKSKDKWFDLRIPSTPTSAQSSPKPAPPPTPKPSTSPGAIEGDQPLEEALPGEGIPTIPGVVPSSLAPTPSPGL
ncbi:MAG: cell division protein FtsQ/DivIB, partial [Candidatus Nanopelagicales bacterium]